MRILVLGGGAQGSACAFDLLQREGVESVVVADLQVDRVARFLRPWLGTSLEVRRVDASRDDELAAAMGGADAVACALPYTFNLRAARLAIAAGAHFCDLGGNTEIVRGQLALDASARAAGVSVVPDCGLAPGMVNILAETGIRSMETVTAVRVFVGGLPRHPEPPLNYRLAYSLEGVLDYYTTPVLKLEGGAVVERGALTELEEIDFPRPLGRLEAFLTAGGISTMPYAYEGKIPEMSYKTLRYPGHAHLMAAIRDLGLIDTTPVEVSGCRVTPREVFIETVTPRLSDPDGEDLVAMRVVVDGHDGTEARSVRFDLIDHQDAEHGISAMMRTTGYSLAAVARLQASGVVTAGVKTAWECVPGEAYITELAELGVKIERRET